MSLLSNFEYIRDGINAKFLKKSDIDLSVYYTKDEVNGAIDNVRVNPDLYLSKEEYATEEEIIASALTDLDERIINVQESQTNNFLGEDEERVIAIALTNLNKRTGDIININGDFTFPTATNGTVDVTTIVNGSINTAQDGMIKNEVAKEVKINGNVGYYATVSGYTGYFYHNGTRPYVLSYDGTNSQYIIRALAAS